MATWNALFETQPTGGDSPSLGDNEIRSLKEAVRERVAKEHVMTTGSGTAANHGWHQQGAALAYYTAVSPAYLPDGSTALGADAKSKGRLWLKAGGGDILLGYNGASWIGVTRELVRVSIQGTLATGTNVLPPICFPRNVLISRMIARCGTVPGTAGNPVYIDVVKRANTGTASASLFNAAANRLTLSNGVYYCVRTTGQMSTTKLSVSTASWLQIDLDAVGGSTKGADLSIEIEAILK